MKPSTGPTRPIKSASRRVSSTRTGALTREHRRQAGRLREDVHPTRGRGAILGTVAVVAEFAVLVGSQGTGVRLGQARRCLRGTVDGTARNREVSHALVDAPRRPRSRWLRPHASNPATARAPR